MKPTAYLMLGLPGSGKTTYSKNLAKKLDLPRLSLDEEYFAMVGSMQREYWDVEIVRQVSEKIKHEALDILKKGQSVIIDYCPWTRQERDEYNKSIEANGAECHIFYFDVPKNELLRRLDKRNKLRSPENQYITPEMLDDYSDMFDPPKNEKVEIVKFH